MEAFLCLRGRNRSLLLRPPECIKVGKNITFTSSIWNLRFIMTADMTYRQVTVVCQSSCCEVQRSVLSAVFSLHMLPIIVSVHWFYVGLITVTPCLQDDPHTLFIIHNGGPVAAASVLSCTWNSLCYYWYLIPICVFYVFHLLLFSIVVHPSIFCMLSCFCLKGQEYVPSWA